MSVIRCYDSNRKCSIDTLIRTENRQEVKIKGLPTLVRYNHRTDIETSIRRTISMKSHATLQPYNTYATRDISSPVIISDVCGTGQAFICNVFCPESKGSFDWRKRRYFIPRSFWKYKLYFLLHKRQVTI